MVSGQYLRHDTSGLLIGGNHYRTPLLAIRARIGFIPFDTRTLCPFPFMVSFANVVHLSFSMSTASYLGTAEARAEVFYS